MARTPEEEDERNAWALRPIGLAVHLGGGTPVGALGVEGDYAVLPQLSLGVGVGEGSGPPNGSGVHGAVLARVRPSPHKENAFVMGAAYSFGNYKHTSWAVLGAEPSYTASFAQWGQIDFGWEHRAKKGLMIGVTAGLAWLLNPSSVTCTPSSSASDGFFSPSSESCQDVAGERLVTIDFNIGYAFGG